MSASALPIDAKRVHQELEKASETERHRIADTVIQIVAAGPPEREPRSEVPDLLNMEGFLREDGDETERPGTMALMESRQQDERKDEELLDQLSSDE